MGKLICLLIMLKGNSKIEVIEMFNVKGLWLYDKEKNMRVLAENKAKKIGDDLDKINVKNFKLNQRIITMESRMKKAKNDNKRLEDEVKKLKLALRRSMLSNYDLRVKDNK